MVSMTYRYLRTRNVVLCLTLIGLALIAPLSAQDDAPKWSYEWRAGDVFAYQITINADRPDATDQLSGVATYTVRTVTDKQTELSFAGQLHRQETAKKSESAGGPPRPGFRGPGRSGQGGPLFRNETMTGLLWQTNDLKLTKAGSIVSLKGTSYLPYLLGNLSLLPFENFPADAKKAWQVDLAASVVESGSESRLPFHRFFSADSQEKRTSATEIVKYELDRKAGQVLTVKRAYDFATVPQEGKGTRYGLVTGGSFDFDAGRSLTTQAEFKGQFTVKEGTVTIDVPLTIKLKLLSDAERKQHEEKQKAELAERQAKLKELQAKNAEKLAQPLTDAERNEIIKTLQSGRPANVMSTLMGLQKRDPTAADKEIAKAIKPLLEDKNGGIRRQAADAWAKWSKLLMSE